MSMPLRGECLVAWVTFLVTEACLGNVITALRMQLSEMLEDGGFYLQRYAICCVALPTLTFQALAAKKWMIYERSLEAAKGIINEL